MTVRKLRDLATALMDQYPDDSEEWFARRFAAKCQSDTRSRHSAVFWNEKALRT